MVSNKFARKRGIQRRPVVCIPPLPPPVPGGVASISTTWNSFFHYINYELAACKDSLAKSGPVTSTVTVDPSLPLTTYQQATNCDALGEGFATLSVPGVNYHFHYVAAFTDGSTAEADSYFTQP